MEQEKSAADVAGEAFDKFAYGEPEVESQVEESDDSIDDYEAGQDPVEEGDDSSDSDEDAAQASEEEGPEYIEVEIDGKLYQVPPELKDAVMRTSDYTQKTQELSAQRKQAEIHYKQLEQVAERFKFAESVQADALKAEQLRATADQYNKYMRENIDSLSVTEIEKLRLAISDAKDESQKIAGEIQRKQEEFQQAQQQTVQELLKKGTEVLRTRIPTWGEESAKQVRDYALSNGFTEAEIAQVVDPREVEVLYKASLYDALKEGAAPAVKKVLGAPKITPKARQPMSKDVGDSLNLRKRLKSDKLSNSEKASALGDHLARKFGM
jgi:hypothetical protein